VEKTGAQLEALANNPEFKKTFDNLNAGIADLRATIGKLDAQIEPTSREFAATLAEAKKTMESFRAAAATAQTFIATNGGVVDDISGTLAHLNDAADAVKRLADFLERNPNALITGRKRPE
jgi:paraquat-inducible protein B